MAVVLATRVRVEAGRFCRGGSHQPQDALSSWQADHWNQGPHLNVQPAEPDWQAAHELSAFRTKHQVTHPLGRQYKKYQVMGGVLIDVRLRLVDFGLGGGNFIDQESDPLSSTRRPIATRHYSSSVFSSSIVWNSWGNERKNGQLV